MKELERKLKHQGQREGDSFVCVCVWGDGISCPSPHDLCSELEELSVHLSQGDKETTGWGALA